jgi:cytochrome c oxidase cbb3-type subunit 3
VPEAIDLEAKRERVREVIAKGVTRKMPAWHDRLSDTQIKLLTVYVHELGGGQ